MTLIDDMAADFGWSLDDFWDEGELTPEQMAADRRSLEQEARDDMLGEMYHARECFD